MPERGERAVKLSATDIRFIIGEMLDCRMRRQYDRFLSHVDPEVVTHCHSWREGVLGPNVWSGVDGLRELFSRSAPWEVPKQAPRPQRKKGAAR